MSEQKSVNFESVQGEYPAQIILAQPHRSPNRCLSQTASAESAGWQARLLMSVGCHAHTLLEIFSAYALCSPLSKLPLLDGPFCPADFLSNDARVMVPRPKSPTPHQISQVWFWGRKAVENAQKITGKLASNSVEKERLVIARLPEICPSYGHILARPYLCSQRRAAHTSGGIARGISVAPALHPTRHPHSPTLSCIYSLKTLTRIIPLDAAQPTISQSRAADPAALLTSSLARSLYWAAFVFPDTTAM